MSRDLRLLMVEDSEADAHLLLRELRRGGYQVSFERVETGPALRAALQRGPWDMIISDCGMPGFNAMTALTIARGEGSDIPFIVLSGTLDEEDAVEVLRAGANDFLTKQRIARLLPAVERELREKAVRDEGKNSQQRVKVTEERFRTLLESAPDGMVIVGSDGRIAFVNNQMEMLFGHTREDLVGQPIEVLVPTPFRGALQAQRASFFESAEPLPVGAGLELTALRRDGTEFPVEIRLSPARTAEGDVVTAAIRDVTARKNAERALRNAEAQLRHAQKMEAVGTLAGGIAHDFNNVLSVILSYAGFLTDALNPADPLRGDVDEITKAATRAVQLTRQLLAFSRKQTFAPRVVDPNEVVRGLDGLLRRVAGGDFELALVPGLGVGAILADPGHIEQILMNLVVNARDAMPKGGSVRVETAYVEVRAGQEPPCPNMSPGPYVLIRVSDTGIGMDAETRARIFEPFFTTKEIGKGTGLGLAVVYGIVAQSAGFIAVDTAPGKGTTFRVYFPQTTEKTEEGSVPPPSSSTGGSETILLVEDDRQVRVAIATTLRRSGYTVIESENAGEALLACEQSATRIDLMLTDVIMPRMTGHELAARLSQLRPSLKVLYMSGHIPDALLEETAISSSIIEKPMTAGALLSKVREIIDRETVSGASKGS
jgi:PAS domain S-box-containing protein